MLFKSGWGNREIKNPYEKTYVIRLLQFSLFIVLTVFLFISGCINVPNPPDTNTSVSGNTTIVITDEANNSFTLSHPAEKIVVLQRHTVECLIDIGAGDKIFGVSDDVAKDPRFMSQLPNATNIGSSKSPDIEKITSLKPDVVILATSTSENIKKRLMSHNITVLDIYCNILPDIPSSVEKLGSMTGKTENAERYLRFYKKYDALIEEKLIDITPDQQPDVYIELSSKYLTAGNRSAGDALLDNIKAKNIAHNLTLQYPSVSPEWVVTNNPDIIIKMVEHSTERQNNFDVIYETVINRTDFSGIRAIETGRVYVISGNVLYGPRGVIGQLYLGKIFYPDRFRDVDPDSVLNQYASEFLPYSDDIDTIYPKFSITPLSLSDQITLNER